MDSKAKKEEKEHFEKPKWLGELQQKSWEPEVLLSGIVLYGMFQAPGLLDELLKYMEVNFDVQTTDYKNIIALFKVSIYWLTFGLILHLISRGIWIGMVGLSFTFPKGVNKDELNYKGPFQKKIDKIPAIEKIIINLEKISSMLFSISFLMFMIIVGAYFYLFLTIIVPMFVFVSLLEDSWSSDLLKYTPIYIIPVFLIGIVGFIDFLTLGYFRRFKWMARIMYPLHVWVSIFTLSRFYRPIYYTLISNINKYKVALVLLVFVFSSIYFIESEKQGRYLGDTVSSITMWGEKRDLGVFTGYYDDQNDDVSSIEAQIQSDIISSNTVRLFVVSHATREQLIKEHCDYDSIDAIDGVNKYEASLRCLNAYYQVTLNDSIALDQQFYFHYKSKTNQKGLLTYIDISDLPKGMHSISIFGRLDNGKRRFYAEIPFYREISDVPYQVIQNDSENKDEIDSYLKLKPILPK